MKPTTLLLLILAQALFVAYGLVVTFWTINAWMSDEKLNALFGGFLGFLFFLIVWRLLRRWARAYFRIGDPRG